MKFKTEIFLLSVAIVLFVFSAYFYFYETGSLGLNETLGFYPYKFFALSLVGTGSVLTVVASVSYTRRSKENLQ